MGTKRNRSAGHSFELDVIEILKARGIYPHAGSTRNNSRARDAHGIDIMNCDEGENGRMCDDIQCKNMVTRPDYAKLLKGLEHDKRYPVVLHRYTKKSKGGKFMKQGDYAITTMDVYMKLLAYRKAYNIIALIPDIENIINPAILGRLKQLGVI